MSDSLMIGLLLGWIAGGILVIILIKTGWMNNIGDWILGVR